MPSRCSERRLFMRSHELLYSIPGSRRNLGFLTGVRWSDGSGEPENWCATGKCELCPVQIGAAAAIQLSRCHDGNDCCPLPDGDTELHDLPRWRSVWDSERLQRGDWVRSGDGYRLGECWELTQ